MRPISITLERFGPFATAQTLEFPDGPGLYFMEGINRAEPELGSNGAGKSTVWKALTWVMFGKDPRGLKAGDVASWSAPKGASVSLEFEANGGAWCVRRTHAPNSWRLRAPEDVMCEEGFGGWTDLSGDGARALELRLTFAAWLNCVVMPQGGRLFLDLKAEEKATLFAEVLGLDRWLSYSRRAKESADAEDARLRELERREAHLRGQAEAGADDLDGLSAEFERGRADRLADVTKKYEELLELQDAAKKREVESIAAQHAADSALKSALSSLEDQEDRYLRGYVDAARQARDDHVRLKQRHVDAELRVKELGSSDTCPTCGTSGIRTGDHMSELQSRCAALSMDARDAYGRMKSAEEKLAAATKRTAGFVEEANSAGIAARGAAAAAAAERNRVLRAERELDALEERADSIQAEVNPYDSMRENQRRAREATLRELDEVQDRASQSRARAEMLGFWVRGFKDIRLQLIAEALAHLEAEVNAELPALGLDGWELGFAVDAETKTGGVSRGFAVHVRSPRNDRRVPWDSWSGGEAQRLRLAAQMGFADLVRQTTGAGIGIEVWDEPTDGMSDGGIARLLDALKARAHAERRQVWVVDHRSLGYAGWDGQALVVKTRRGSHFEAG